MKNRLSQDNLYKWLEKSRGYGFLSPQPIVDQIEHSQSFVELIPNLSGKVLDLGAGGGLPGFVILALSDVELTALDAMRKRTDFLEEFRTDCEMHNRFHIVNGRAEELSIVEGYKGNFDFIVSRGFGSPAYTAECSANFLKTDGVLVVSGRPENEEDRWDEQGLNKLGLSLERVVGSDKAHIALIRKIKETPKMFPRNTSSIKKSPLW